MKIKTTNELNKAFVGLISPQTLNLQVLHNYIKVLFIALTIGVVNGVDVMIGKKVVQTRMSILFYSLVFAPLLLQRSFASLF